MGWVGKSEPPQTDHQGSSYDQAASREHPDVSASSDHKCRDRRPKLQDPDAQGQGSRLPKLRELPHAHPVLLRQARPLPTIIPEEGHGKVELRAVNFQRDVGVTFEIGLDGEWQEIARATADSEGAATTVIAPRIAHGLSSAVIRARQ